MVAVVVLLGAVLAVAGTIRRGVRGRDITSDTGVGRNAALLTAVVSLACFAAMAYVVLI